MTAAHRSAASTTFHYKYLEETSRAMGKAGIYVVLADDPKNVPRISKEIDGMFRTRRFRRAPTPSARSSCRSSEDYMGNVKLFLMSLCVAVTFMLMLVSGNTIAMAVRERGRRGDRRPQDAGLAQSRVLVLLVATQVLISVIGAAFGLMGSWRFCVWIAGRNTEFSPTCACCTCPARWWGSASRSRC